jgi:hypothetical protein
MPRISIRRLAPAAAALAAASGLGLALAATPASAAGSCSGASTPSGDGVAISVTCDFGTRSFQLLSSEEISAYTGFDPFGCAIGPVDQPSPNVSQLGCRIARGAPGDPRPPQTRVAPGEPIEGTLSFAGGLGCDGDTPVALSFYTTESLDDVEYEGEVVFDVCAAGGSGGGSAEPPVIPARDLPSTLTVRGARALVRVTCQATQTCGRVSVTLRHRRGRKPLLGRATVTVGAGSTKRVEVRLTKAGKRALRRSKKVPARLSVRSADGGSSQNVTLRRPR